MLLEHLYSRPLLTIHTANPSLYTHAQDLEAIEVGAKVVVWPCALIGVSVCRVSGRTFF